MKKLIALTAIFVMVASPVMAIAGTGSVTTGLTRDVSGGETPIVKVKWEANVDKYTDASTNAGAQFLPSGQHGVSKTIALCAIVTDPDGLADIDNVYADVFYPENIELGPSHTPLTDQSGEGCGQLMQEDSMARLEKGEGYNLFCNLVKNNNNNLPTFNAGYNYDEICATDGELMKETAAVYCTTKDLSYEDPAGDYEVWAIAQDTVGLQGRLINHFTYLPVTAFETDFNSVVYGNVRLNIHKIISGDLIWGNNKASVRNVGNTRLSMHVWQDDMGLGKTGGDWNVVYDARVGSNAPFAVYEPETTNQLADPLDLSELDEMDFSVEISKFPPTHQGDNYTGTMILSATSEPHLVCGETGEVPQMLHISLENKNTQWQVISDDITWGDIDYSHNYSDFHGVVTGTGLVPNGYYQISFNGPTEPSGDCGFTNLSLGNFGSNTFESGFWNSAYPNLSPTCTSDDEEGVYNVNLIDDHYTFQADGSGAFNYPFALNLPAGHYSGVKVLVKKMLDTHVSPWVDIETTGVYPQGPYPAYNLYETAAISFTVL